MTSAVSIHGLPTPKEMAILNQAAWIRQKLEWLEAHPGKTRRDWNAGIKDTDSDIWKWLRATSKAADAAERADWLRDHPGNPLPEHLCALTAAEGEELDRWREKRGAHR
jgi:hypothetical protein